MSLGTLAGEKSVLVVCGSGGVGKTTGAAAIALMAARTSSRKVLAITVDPAKRLADVLGLDTTNEAPTKVDIGDDAKGEFYASMLDTKSAWDELVKRHAPDEQTRQRIIGNPLYREITGRFVQSHDYIAMETLHQLHTGGEWDLIVIDTPPSSQAVDFLDAPERMASFFDSRLLKFLVAPQRASLFSVASRAFMQVADRLLGKRFLADITEFFGLLETMRPGFIARANEVSALMRAPGTSFVAVTTPEPAPSRSIARFVSELQKREMTLGAVILNRVLPAAFSDVETAKAAAEVSENFDALAAGFPEPERAKRVLTTMATNYERFAALVAAERDLHVDLAPAGVVRASAPLFEGELSNALALRRLGESIWD